MSSQVLSRKIEGEAPSRPSSSSSITKGSRGSSASKHESGNSHDVITVLNTLHPDLFVPNRHMGWNMFDTIRTTYPFIYRINDGTSNNVVLLRVCEERGWQEFKEPPAQYKGTRFDKDLYDMAHWNLWWSYNFFQGSPYRTLKCWQFTNHNPRAFQFCNKSYLTSFLRKMKADFGEVYNFFPKSFIMPEDYIKFVSEHSKRQVDMSPDAKNVISGEELGLTPAPSDTNNNTGNGDRPSQRSLAKLENKHPIWIIKPIGKSQGKGIVLTTDIGVVAHSSKSVVQEYIARPYLIAGYKWDLRIYVCIASTDPLVIYIYREGLCRFATAKFDLTNLQSCYSHLTNASLNKLSPDYPIDKEVIGLGCKWSLKQLREQLRKEKCNDWILWQKIMSLVLLTVVGEGLKSGYMFPANRNCFDFFGFDILVDSNLEPYLLEVNYSPGLNSDCEVDEIVKRPMLNELFDLLGFPKTPKSRPSSASSLQNSKVDSGKETKTVPRVNKPKLTLDCTKYFDSCKTRLQETALIYSQDLVLEYFGNHCRNPKFNLSPTMKILYERKIAHAKRRERYNKYLENLRKKGKLPPETSEESSEDSEEDSSENTTSEEESKDKEIEAEKEDNEPKYVYIQRQDWQEPPISNGDWCLVFPCTGFPTRSPYRSALAELRGVVKAIENYMSVAQSVVNSYPDESDEFYSSKVKALCRWNVDIWCPPCKSENEGDEDIVPILR